jgi:hypothetical protein
LETSASRFISAIVFARRKSYFKGRAGFLFVVTPIDGSKSRHAASVIHRYKNPFPPTAADHLPTRDPHTTTGEACMNGLSDTHGGSCFESNTSLPLSPDMVTLHLVGETFALPHT